MLKLSTSLNIKGLILCVELPSSQENAIKPHPICLSNKLRNIERIENALADSKFHPQYWVLR